MLTRDENELLCGVGPDSPMGRVLRRYWFPAFLLSDLPAPDAPPIGVSALGENFVAFRDSQGRLGFLDELCCHRGASLTYGRAEEGGLRCIYHGWKCDVAGNLLETPNAMNSGVREHVKQGSYPVREAGGLGWVYLGPPGTEPPLPRYPWMDHPPEELSASEVLYDCNWLQVQEGSLDSSHLGITHLDNGVVMYPGPPNVGSLRLGGIPWSDEVRPPGARAGMPTNDNDPVVEVENTPFGFHYAALRTMPGTEDRYVRITAVSLPYTCHITSASSAVIVVPRDDESCSTITIGTRRPGTTSPSGTAGGVGPDGMRTFRFPSDGRRYTLPAQDRRAMTARTSFAGFRDGNRPQDASVQGVNGKLRAYHRRNEHLVQADAAIVRLRHLLLESVRLVEAGEPPAGLAEFDHSKLQAASAVIPPGTAWQDLVPENRGATREGAAVT